jgi:hypothetical protein
MYVCMYVYMCVVDGDRNEYIDTRICIPNLTLLFWIYCTQRAVTTYFHMLDVICGCGSLLQVSSASGLHFVGERLMLKFLADGGWEWGSGKGEVEIVVVEEEEEEVEGVGGGGLEISCCGVSSVVCWILRRRMVYCVFDFSVKGV